MIAIISILAGMLLPALNKAREKARASDCTNRLKQIGQANAMYLSDAKDYYPVKGSGTVSAALPAWTENLLGNHYISGSPQKIFRCPSLATEPAHWVSSKSYGVNWRKDDNSGEWLDYGNIKRLRKPSVYVTHADTIFAPGHANWPNQCYSFGWKKSRDGAVHTRHGERANVVMADGHVSALGVREFKTYSLSYAILENRIIEVDTTL